MSTTGRRRIVVVLFLDIVGSTAIASEFGDDRWRAVLVHFREVVRRELERHGGSEENTTGDGFFATFAQPALALRCAAAIAAAVQEVGVNVRSGVHVGECEEIEGQLGGLAVHIAARVMSLAGAATVLATSTTKELMTGPDAAFDDIGMHELKGVDGQWHLYSLRSIKVELPPPLAPQIAAERLSTPLPVAAPAAAPAATPAAAETAPGAPLPRWTHVLLAGLGLAVVALAAALGVVLATGGSSTPGASAMMSGTRLYAALSSVDELGSGDSSGSGTATLTLTGTSVCWSFQLQGLVDLIAAHIHRGGPGVSGPIVVPLGGSFKPSGCTTAPVATVREVLAHPARYYVNVHTFTFPDGAVRGQLTTSLTTAGKGSR